MNNDPTSFAAVKDTDDDDPPLVQQQHSNDESAKSSTRSNRQKYRMEERAKLKSRKDARLKQQKQAKPSPIENLTFGGGGTKNHHPSRVSDGIQEREIKEKEITSVRSSDVQIASTGRNRNNNNNQSIDPQPSTEGEEVALDSFYMATDNNDKKQVIEKKPKELNLVAEGATRTVPKEELEDAVDDDDDDDKPPIITRFMLTSILVIVGIILGVHMSGPGQVNSIEKGDQVVIPESSFMPSSPTASTYSPT
jgi:hypothetical protein